MASINLGRVGFVLRGTWTSGTTYNPLDVVLYNGTSYVAKTTSTNLDPSSASAAWQDLIDISTAVAIALNAMAVRYDADQFLTSAQQAVARANISAASTDDITDLETDLSGDITALQTALDGKITISGTTIVIA